MLPPCSPILAFIGQLSEIVDDVVFTVEYSIHSSKTAVYSLFGLDKTLPSVYKGNHDSRVILEAFLTLHGKADWEALLVQSVPS